MSKPSNVVLLITDLRPVFLNQQNTARVILVMFSGSSIY